jgi:hypothetical protein
MKKYSLKQDITPFLLILQQLFVTKVVEKTFLVEGVIEIIFIGKFSQNFPRHEDDSSSTTSLVCTAIIGFLHSLWCGLLFYPVSRQCEKPTYRIRLDSPTPFFVV